jgi:hypothetical protein
VFDVEHAGQVRAIDEDHEPELANTAVLSGDLEAAIGEVKAKARWEPPVAQRRRSIQVAVGARGYRLDQPIYLPRGRSPGDAFFPDSGPEVDSDWRDRGPAPQGMTIQVYGPAAARWR